MSTIQRFFLVFGLCLITQLFIWNHVVVVDQDLWVQRMETFVPHKLTPEDVIHTRFSNTPGTLGLLLAQAISHFGIPAQHSLALSISLLVSVSAAIAASLAHALTPRTPWWIPVGVIIATHQLYTHATPADAVAAPLLAVCALTFLWYEKKPKITSTKSDVLFALALGAAAATRLLTTGLLALPALVLLQRIIGWRRLILICASALAFTVALNPLLGYIPGTYIQIGVLKGAFTYSEKKSVQFEEIPFHISDLSFASFAIVSFAIGAVYVLRWSYIKRNSPVSRRFIGWLMGITILVSVVLFSTSIPIPRYFFPIVLIWEILLPLFIFHVCEQLYTSRRLLVHTFIVALTTLPPISLLVFTLLL